MTQAASARRRLGVMAAIAACVLVSGAARGAVLSFYCISQNDPWNALTGEAQFTCDVVDLGDDGVLFTFRNSGPEPCAITDLYWDDGTLLDLVEIIDADDGGAEGAEGVDFSPDATPRDLPAGNEVIPPFVTTASYSADSDPAIIPNGVGPGEWLGVRYTLKSGGTFLDVLDELTTGVLRVGLSGQAFVSGGSESFVNVPLPEPAALSLLALGGLALTWRKKRKRNP